MKNLVPEVGDSRFKMHDDGSAEYETLNFLRYLVELIKPNNVLETGTYKGYSACYMAKGLQANGFGRIETMEIDTRNIAEAKELWAEEGVMDVIDSTCSSSLDYKTDKKYELILLDTEPNIRFKEFVKFYGNLAPGGFLFIHDLHRHLSQGVKNPDHPDYEHWPFGELPAFIKNCVTNGETVMIQFPTPRGLTGFYKKHPEDYQFKR
jgi:predicted O-methyltransferase YrrM